MNNASFIWNRQQCIEAYDELMIKIAMSSYAEIDGQEALQENERLKKSPQFKSVSKAEKNIRRIVQREMLQNTVYHFGKSVYSVANKVALLFLAITIIFSTAMFVSASFRNAIYKLVFTYEKQYTLIELDSRTALKFVDSEIYTWEHAFAPTMMPQGYAVSDVASMTGFHLVLYTNDKGEYIEFFQSNSGSNGAIQIDTENAQLVQNVFINDSEGILTSKNGVNTLIWRIGNVFLRLESNADTETLISIAKSIKLLK